MVKDALGDRMKAYYEDRSKTYLSRRTPVIIRIDGCHFHSFCKGLRKPYDSIFIKTMQDTTRALCEVVQGCKIGYVESDEISLLLTDYDSLQTDAWFDYAVQKVCSVAASITAMYFNKFFAKNVEEWNKNNIDPSNDDAKYYELLKNRIELGGYFDARAFNVPENEVVNYFIWRQNDATRNSINSLGQAYFSQKQMQGKNTSQVQEMLFSEKGINWNDCTIVEKRGTCVIKKEVPRDVNTPVGIMSIVRNEWTIDKEIPIFTQDRSYIERVLPKVENTVKE